MDVSTQPSHTCLATIERIKSIEPIEGADAIEKAEVLGYVTVVKKGEFKIDELVVWHQPDTICPNKPVYSFLEKDGFRLKAKKIRGVVSQGLALSLRVAFGDCGPVVEGMDVTERIGIQKYQKPEFDGPFNSGKKSAWPGFLKKTDEFNLRSHPLILKDLVGKEVVITQKIDGSSVTFFSRFGVFGVCSRNLMIEPTEDNDYWMIARRYNLHEKLVQLSEKKGVDLCVQGEMYGPKIQKNKLGVTERTLALFNLFDVTHGVYMDYDRLVEVASDLAVPLAPLVWRGNFQFSLSELIEMANAQQYQNKNPAEGIVVRPTEEVFSSILQGRLSGKVISEKFALKYGE